MTDVSEGKNDPIYNAHSYHTKVPYKAIIPFIEHYTEPGDIVFDGFCGTGMTGVAAQMVGRLSAAVRYCTSESHPIRTSHSRPMCTGHVHPMCTRVTAPLLHIPYPCQHHRNGEAGRDDAGQEKNDRGHS